MGTCCSQTCCLPRRTGVEQVPIIPSEATSAWFSAALALPDGTQVVSAKVQPLLGTNVAGKVLEDGGGISGSHLVRIRLEYKGPCPGPESIVYKVGETQHIFTVIKASSLLPSVCKHGAYESIPVHPEAWLQCCFMSLG
jgi:hypothetical protein